MEQMHTRSSFLKLGGAVLGAAALPGVALGAPNRLASSLFADATTLKLANDKVTWKAWFNTAGEAAANAIGIGWDAVEYADTTSYQAAIRTSGRTYEGAGPLLVVVGLADEGDRRRRLRRRRHADLEQERGVLLEGRPLRVHLRGKEYGAPSCTSATGFCFTTSTSSRTRKLKPPTTWAEFEKAMATLKANGVTPLAATIDGRWPGFIYFEEFLLRSNPGLYQRLMAGKAKYTDAGVVSAMKLSVGADLSSRATSPTRQPSRWARGQQLHDYFKQGKVGMVQIGTWFEPTLVAGGMKPGTDFGSFIMPNINPRAPKVVVYETGPMVVAEHGSNKADALKALDYFMSRQGQATWVKATGFVSPRTDVPSTSPVDRQLGAEIAKGGYTQFNRYWEATPHDIVEVAVDQFDKFMLKGGDPLPILQTIQKQADKTWSTVK